MLGVSECCSERDKWSNAQVLPQSPARSQAGASGPPWRLGHFLAGYFGGTEKQETLSLSAKNPLIPVKTGLTLKGH